MQRKILVFGANGQVGREILRLAGDAAQGFDHAAVDISDQAAVNRAVSERSPSAIVNAAGYTAVDQAENEPDAVRRANRDGAALLARTAAACGVPFIQISTDYVFDGTKQSPYKENDPVTPLSIYGRSKEEGERKVREVCLRHVILRTSWVYSAHGTNFVRTILRLGAERPELRVVDDQTGCPTSAADLAGAILGILAQAERPRFTAWGTYHYRGGDIVTWYGFADLIFKTAAEYGVDPPRLSPICTNAYPTSARRPAYSVLSTDKLEATFGIKSRPLGDSLRDCLAQILVSKTV